MTGFDLAAQPTWVLVVVFLGGVVALWPAGHRLSRVADGLARATGLHGALVGMVLLGGMTSLPELATLTTASVRGDAPLAVNNMVGGVAMQVAVLAAADAAIGRAALASSVRDPGIVVQGALSVILLALVAAGVLVGERAVGGVGAWTLAIGAAFAGGLWVVRSTRAGVWTATGTGPPTADDDAPLAPRRLAFELLGLGVLILVAGFVLTRAGEGLAERTGLGSSFFGVVFLAAATSLPELSTAIAAARLGRPEMAIADVFGGNLVDVSLILVADVLYDGPPILDEVDTLSVIAALLAIVLTSLVIVGVIERRDRTVLGMGVDSLVILATYAGGLVVLYQLR